MISEWRGKDSGAGHSALGIQHSRDEHPFSTTEGNMFNQVSFLVFPHLAMNQNPGSLVFASKITGTAGTSSRIHMVP